MLTRPTLFGHLLYILIYILYILNISVQYFCLVLYLAPCVNVPPSVSSKHIMVIQFGVAGAQTCMEYKNRIAFFIV